MAFHAELEHALRLNYHILLVHETRKEAKGTTFKEIIDATPEYLKWDEEKRAKRLYKELAIMICGQKNGGEEHLNVGLHLLLNAAASPSPPPPAHSTAASSMKSIAELHTQLRKSSPAMQTPAVLPAPVTSAEPVEPVPPPHAEEVALLHEQVGALEAENAALQAKLQAALRSASEPMYLDVHTRTLDPISEETPTGREELVGALGASETSGERPPSFHVSGPRPEVTLPLREPKPAEPVPTPIDTLRALGTSLGNLLFKQEPQTNEGSGSVRV